MARIGSPSEMSDYCLDRLFDPEDLYYVPMEELIKRYKKRDLLPGKLFNIAQKYHSAPETRHRVITAPPMEKLHHRYLDSNSYYTPPAKIFYCTKPNTKKNDDEDKENNDNNRELTDEEKLEEHKIWLEKRKKLRNDLNNMGLNLEYLKRKKDLSELEKRVLRRMMFIDQQTQTDEKKEKRRPKNTHLLKPQIILPTPIAMQKIENVLDKNKWRLVDLFADLDKNKDWRLQESDFMRENSDLEITDGMLDELIMAYGNTQKKIKYKELAKGRKSLVLDKRVSIRDAALYATFLPTSIHHNDTSTLLDEIKPKSNKSDESIVNKHSSHSSAKSGVTKLRQSNDEFEREKSSLSREQSAVSKISTDSSLYLRVPSIDSREAFYPQVNSENRGTSAPVFYSVKTASRPQTSKNKDNMTINEMITEFRNKVKIDTEYLKQSRETVDLNEKQFRAFEYPKEFEKSKIIADILDKKRLKREKKLLEEKKEWERKRLKMKLKNKN